MTVFNGQILELDDDGSPVDLILLTNQRTATRTYAMRRRGMVFGPVDRLGDLFEGNLLVKAIAAEAEEDLPEYKKYSATFRDHDDGRGLVEDRVTRRKSG